MRASTKASLHDVCRSTPVQTGNIWGDATTEPFSRLQAAASSLSSGPVAPADKIGSSNVELIMMSCMADGTLLQVCSAMTLMQGSVFFQDLPLLSEPLIEDALAASPAIHACGSSCPLSTRCYRNREARMSITRVCIVCLCAAPAACHLHRCHFCSTRWPGRRPRWAIVGDFVRDFWINVCVSASGVVSVAVRAEHC